MATAMGNCTPPIVAAVREVAGVDRNKRPRLVGERVLEPEWATSATPVDSLMATPIGLVPTATSATASVFVKRFTMDAVPALLLATTAIPRCELTATPWGVAPMEMLRSTVPKVALLGLMSMVERLLQPLLVTNATGENGPPASWSAIATELGVGGPGLQATVMSTDLMTMKSVALDCTPPLITSSAKRCGADKNEAGIVAVIFLPLGSTATLADGMAAPSRRTFAPEVKPEPKICTPARSLAEVRVACGTRAVGIPPITPGAGLVLGTTTVLICVAFSAPRLMTSIFPAVWGVAGGLPDSTPKAL